MNDRYYTSSPRPFPHGYVMVIYRRRGVIAASLLFALFLSNSRYYITSRARVLSYIASHNRAVFSLLFLYTCVRIRGKIGVRVFFFRRGLRWNSTPPLRAETPRYNVHTRAKVRIISMQMIRTSVFARPRPNMIFFNNNMFVALSTALLL